MEVQPSEKRKEGTGDATDERMDEEFGDVEDGRTKRFLK